MRTRVSQRSLSPWPTQMGPPTFQQIADESPERRRAGYCFPDQLIDQGLPKASHPAPPQRRGGDRVL
jgi:hypothetical protein